MDRMIFKLSVYKSGYKYMSTELYKGNLKIVAYQFKGKIK